jgi:4-hydroxy-tetrahydrodipicolinate reductase
MSEKAHFNVLVNGLGGEGTGKMASIIARGILNSDDYRLCDIALTGPGQPESVWVHVQPGSRSDKQVSLIPPEKHEEVLEKFSRQPCPHIAIDFCKGDGVADRNAELYCKYNIPFVMGSTGAKDDYANIEKLAIEHEVPCVAAPNMDPQIVSFMDGIRYMAEHYPGSWEGYSFELSETHQADKINKETGLPETSGTKKAMLKNLGALANRKLIIGDILSERNPRNQMIYWQVPELWAGWHAYHIFKAFKPVENGEDSLAITLKRHGGECYGQGTMKALDWLIDGINRDLFNNDDGIKPESQDNRRYFNTMFNVLRKA